MAFPCRVHPVLQFSVVRSFAKHLLRPVFLTAIAADKLHAGKHSHHIGKNIDRVALSAQETERLFVLFCPGKSEHVRQLFQLQPLHQEW